MILEHFDLYQKAFLETLGDKTIGWVSGKLYQKFFLTYLKGKVLTCGSFGVAPNFTVKGNRQRKCAPNGMVRVSWISFL